MLYFLIYLFLEITISVEISSEIGGLWTFIEIVLSAFIGISMLRNFKFTLRDKLQSLYNGEIAKEDFVKLNLISIIGVILITIPGFFTDILGVLLQFNFFALFITDMFLKNRGSNNVYYKNENFNNMNNNFNNLGGKKDEEIIDVEVIDDRGGK